MLLVLLPSDPNKPSVAKELHAHRAIVTCGAYTNSILKPLGFEIKFDIWEMVYAYWSVSVTGAAHGASAGDAAGDAKELFPSMWFLFAEDDEEGHSQLFYGFPPLPWGPPDMARIALDAAKRVVGDPAHRQPGPSEDDLKLNQARGCRGSYACMAGHIAPDCGSPSSPT